MLAKTGLLIVSNPKQIGKILSSIEKQVNQTLYIQLLSALCEPLGNFYTNVFNTWPKYSQTIYGIYSQAAAHCTNLDVRVLLSGLKTNHSKISTLKPVDLIIFDKKHCQNEIDSFIKEKIENVSKQFNVLTLDSGVFDGVKEPEGSDFGIYKHTVLGGTFDRLHNAHKLLLSEAALRSSNKVTVGVTEENMLVTKTLWELVEDLDIRISSVRNFLTDICSDLTYDVVPISDPFGPAIVDPTMEMIVVSQETLKGGQKVNELRKNAGLNELKIIPVELVDEPSPNPIEEKKISSSTGRIRLLGTLLRPVDPNNDIPKKPYVIGLTGGIASGKSGVGARLAELGALVIDCDKIGHNVYKAGKPCYKLLIDHFGQKILDGNGEINRKILGEIVFKDKAQLDVLNSLVWPSIINEVNEIIRTTDKQIVVIEAAVLLKGNWQKHCHEVWVTLVPKEEAVKRLKSRNNLSEEQAVNRIESQLTNKEYVRNAHVVFCTLWPVEYTKQQVLKAWQLLQQRI